MKYGFTFKESMRLHIIKRWGIIDMSRPQSVAEHSYNVALITSAICAELELSRVCTQRCLEWALWHDMSEIHSGDIPTPAKRYLQLNAFESKRCPQWAEYKRSHGKDSTTINIVKIADYIDAIQFAELYCIDENRDVILFEMVSKMRDVIYDCAHKEELLDIVVPWIEHMEFKIGA